MGPGREERIGSNAGRAIIAFRRTGTTPGKNTGRVMGAIRFLLREPGTAMHCKRLENGSIVCFTVEEEDETEAARRRLRERRELYSNAPSLHGAAARLEAESKREES